MTRFHLASLVLLAGTACIVDRNLADTDGSSGDAESTQTSLPDMTATMASTASTAPDTDSVSMTATMSSEDDSTSSTSPADTETETGGPICPSWEPPDLDCGAPGQATVQVQGDEIPQVEDLPCDIAAIENVDANTDSIQLDCDEEIFEIAITTDPYHPLLLSPGQNVILNAAYDEQDWFPPAPPRSFSLRTNNGGLLLAWVNERDAPQDLEVELDLAPVMFELIESGCPGISVGGICDAGGDMLSQRRAVEFSGELGDPVVVFDGNADSVPVGTSTRMLYLDHAQQIACWDADCAASEKGPFEELRMLFLTGFG